MKPPKISVIIPAYNTKKTIAKTINSVLNQTFRNFELLIVNDGSTDNTLNMIKQFKDKRIKIFNQKNQGSYTARNLGIQKSKGKILAFTDSDCIPEKNWLEEGIKSLKKDKNCHIVGGKVNVFAKNAKNPKAIELFDKITYLNQKKYIKKFNFAATANLMTYRKIIMDVGPFNKKLFSGGDNEWCQRAYKKGYKLKYSKRAIVNHPARENLHEIYKKFTRINRGIYRLYFKDLNCRRFILHNIDFICSQKNKTKEILLKKGLKHKLGLFFLLSLETITKLLQNCYLRIEDKFKKQNQ